MKYLYIILISIILALLFRVITTAPAETETFTGNVEAHTPTITPTPSKNEVVKEIVRVFGREGGDVALEAVAIFTCESNLKWNARNDWNTNGSVDIGIAQINSVHGFTEEEMKDYVKNIQYAYELYTKQGWHPWTCARTLGYL